MRRKELYALLDKYIAEHFIGDEHFIDDEETSVHNRHQAKLPFLQKMSFAMPSFLCVDCFKSIVDFDKQFKQTLGETFSEMLLRLVKESGKKPSEIYRRADLDRQTFSRIKTKKDYQPSKDTAIAFAIALKLDLPTTKKLLETAGYALSMASRRDIIISFFIESENFSVTKLNEILFKYGQPVLLNRE